MQKLGSFFLLFLFFVSGICYSAFQCPMHCEGKKTYEKSGECPVCHMALESSGEVQDALNSLKYRVDILTPSKLSAHEPANFIASVIDTRTQEVKNKFQKMDSAIMHWVFMRKDFSLAQHFELNAFDSKGGFSSAVSLHEAGDYIWWVIFQPEGEKRQIFPFDISVDSKNQKGINPKHAQYQLRPNSKNKTVIIKNASELCFDVLKKNKPTSVPAQFDWAMAVSDDITQVQFPHPVKSEKLCLHSVFNKSGRHHLFLFLKIENQPIGLSTSVLVQSAK